MKIKNICSRLPCGVLFFALLSCGKDDDKPKCDTFSSADSVCFCTAHPENINCSNTFAISVYFEEKADLTPHPSNGTLWCKGFTIDHSIYIIDRESDSPHAFLKLDIEENEDWEVKADFPGDGYGLTGSANGKGYASSYASNKFWEYNPTNNEWTPLTDLPFSTGETHWVEYKGKFYVPDNDGIYEFNASTKEWNKISNQTSSGFGAIFLVDDNMYWYDINNDYMSRFNLADKSFEEIDLPEDFGSNVAFNSPFTMDNKAFLVNSNDLWIFDNDAETWSIHEGALESGSAYADDAFLVDGKVYFIDNGYVKAFESVSGE